ncbi:unnamed protein product [Urochloa humidicola]
MDFDEYDYLEKTVEASGAPANGAAAPAGSGEKEKERSSRRRSSGGDEERDDVERRSKRSRSEEGRDRDKERHRDRDRHRSSRERRDRDRDDKEKEREREKDKERRSRDREREKEREREREKDRQRRSRSRSERRRDDEERYRERDVRRRKEEAAEPEVDPERDQRTVFAFQADERDVYEFFSRAGKVRDVRLIMDRNSRRSKGVGYIEFYDAMSVPMAIALSGQLLLGQQVMVKPSEAEKNLVQSTASSSAAASGGARKLYVGNLHSNINEEQLRLVFEPFGQVELVQLPLDPLTGLCKGFGFVQFARLEDAKAAQSLNGQLDIAGRVIKVSAVTDQTGVQVSGATAGDLDDDEGGGLALNASSRALLMQKLDRSGITTSLTGGMATTGLNTTVGIPAVSVLGAAPAAAPVLRPTVPGLGLLPGATLPITTPSIELAPPSECLLLKNMFDPTVETDPDFDLDIRDDVQEECSKFGQLKHIFVDKNTAGFVYLRFDSIAAAMSAQKALHGRWFAGKMITATFMTPQQYEMKFPS